MSSTGPFILNDDLTEVTIDLHGCSVDDGLWIVRRTVQESYWRGRSRVVVIHGKSTSGGGLRTIKSELEKRLAEDEYDEWVTGATLSQCGGRTVLWIKIAHDRNPTRIKNRDVGRR